MTSVPKSLTTPNTAQLHPSLVVPSIKVSSLFGRTFLSFITLSTAFSLLGAFGVFQMDFIHSDAYARSINAYQVLYSRDAHLAAMGLFWPPLPSFLMVPFMPIARLFGVYGIVMSVVIESAVFSAGLVILTYKFLVRLGLGKFPAIALVLFGSLNPLYLYYMVSGATETMFFFFVMAALLTLLMAPDKEASWLLVPGFFSACALLTRYEGLPVAAAITAAAFVLPYHGADRSLRSRFSRSVLAGALPFGTFGFWMVMQWMIMGDPLYFLHSPFSGMNLSDTARNANPFPPHVFAQEMGSVVNAVHLGASFAWVFSVVFCVSAVLGLAAAIWKRDVKIVIVLAVAMAVPAFHTYQIYHGDLGPYVRYWIDYLIWAPLFAGLVISSLGKRGIFKLLRAGMLLASIGGFVYSAYVTFQYMYDNPIGYDFNRNETYVSHYFVDGKTAALQVSAPTHPTTYPNTLSLLETKYKDATILLEQWNGHPLIAEVKNPKRIVMTNDRDFKSILANPYGKVSYLFLYKANYRTPDIIEATYPGIFDNGRSWLELSDEIHEKDGIWRIYKVIGPSN